MHFGVSTGRRTRGEDETQTQLRPDDDQMKKYEEIISLLLAGGYFRARISTLDPFDKVAGGMAWCIRVANESVDIDLLFQEGLRMGEKVHIAENIERALAKMRAPPIQSQELYTMNCVKIFPVVQWLVKKVIEVRAETADVLRQFSESQFGKEYTLPGESATSGLEFLSSSRERYVPSRKFRLRERTVSQGRKSLGTRLSRAFPKNAQLSADVDSHVHAVLVEYGSGHLYTSALLQQTNEKVASDDMAAKRKSVAAALGAGGNSVEEAALAEREAALAAQRREELMLQQMQELKEQSDTGMADLVMQRLKRMQETDANKASADAYKAEQEESTGESTARLQGQYNHRRYLAQVEKLTRAESDKLDALMPRVEEIKSHYESLQAELTAAIEQNRHYESEIERMLALENDDNRDDIAMLRALVALNESLKLQISQFKASCKESMAEWQRLIDEETANADKPLDDRLETIAGTYQKDLAKLKAIQSHLSSKTRAIALVRRKMDEIPSRRELQQYQKHFLELYEQMALRFTETRQYYNTFNTLQDRRDLLQRELNVLNQIQDNYAAAMKNKAAKGKFAENLTAIADQVTKSSEKARDKLKEEKERVNGLDDTHTRAMEKERAYYAAAKQFQAECSSQERYLEVVNQLCANE